jgi:hypothetical protein
MYVLAHIPTDDRTRHQARERRDLQGQPAWFRVNLLELRRDRCMYMYLHTRTKSQHTHTHLGMSGPCVRLAKARVLGVKLLVLRIDACTVSVQTQSQHEIVCICAKCRIEYLSLYAWRLMCFQIRQFCMIGTAKSHCDWHRLILFRKMVGSTLYVHETWRAVMKATLACPFADTRKVPHTL